MTAILSFLIGIIASNYTLKDINGKNVTLDSLLTKGPVLMEFWATWCKPCMKQLDCFKKIKTETDSLKIGGDSIIVSFVGIAEDGPSSKKNVIPVVKKQGWNFVILYDENKMVQQKYQVDAIPQSFLLGKNREIIYHHVGYKKGDEVVLRDTLVAYLKNLTKGDSLSATGK